MFDAKFTPLFIDSEFENRAKEFWNYFYTHHKEIETKINEHNNDFVKEFENNLKKVFIKQDQLIRFSFKKEDNNFLLLFFYGRNSYLLTLADSLFGMKYAELENWKFLVLKR